MVDSTNLPEVDINQIATDLNNKMDRDCLNASDTGNIQMAKASMPSSKYIDLTLNASGSTYTAPADGWVVVTVNGAGFIQATQQKISVFNCNTSASNWFSVLLPVVKGNFSVSYKDITKQGFRFIYAVGSESEAN